MLQATPRIPSTSLPNPTISIIHLGLYTLLVTTTYSSYSYIISHLSPSFGPITLFSNYFIYLLTLSSITRLIRIRLKWIFIVAALCYTTNYVVSIGTEGSSEATSNNAYQGDGGHHYPNITKNNSSQPQTQTSTPVLSFILLILGSGIGGFGAALLWASQGAYLSLLFRQCQIPISQRGGKVALLSAIVYSNNLFGAIVTTFTVGLLNRQIYFGVLIIIGLFGALYAFITLNLKERDVGAPHLNEELDEENRNNEINSHIVQNNLSMHIDSQPNPILEPYLIVSNNKNQNTLALSQSIIPSSIQLHLTASSEQTNNHYLQSFLSIIRFYPKMITILPLILLDGLALSFMSSKLTTILPQPYSDLQAGLLLIWMGAGSIVGGFVASWATDRYPLRSVAIVSTVVLLCASVGTLFCYTLDHKTMPLLLCQAVAFSWGLGLYMVEGWISACCAKRYGCQVESFVVAKQLHSLSFCIYQLLLIFVADADDSLVGVASNVGILSLGGFVVLWLYYKWDSGMVMAVEEKGQQNTIKRDEGHGKDSQPKITTLHDDINSDEPFDLPIQVQDRFEPIK